MPEEHVLTSNTSASNYYCVGAGRVRSQQHSFLVAMDDCGLRYVLAVGHDTYLMKTVSPAQRVQFQKAGFSFSDVIWGFHSESEEVTFVDTKFYIGDIVNLLHIYIIL